MVEVYEVKLDGPNDKPTFPWIPNTLFGPRNVVRLPTPSSKDLPFQREFVLLSLPTSHLLNHPNDPAPLPPRPNPRARYPVILNPDARRYAREESSYPLRRFWNGRGHGGDGGTEEEKDEAFRTWCETADGQDQWEKCTETWTGMFAGVPSAHFFLRMASDQTLHHSSILLTSLLFRLFHDGGDDEPSLPNRLVLHHPPRDSTSSSLSTPRSLLPISEDDTEEDKGIQTALIRGIEGVRRTFPSTPVVRLVGYHREVSLAITQVALQTLFEKTGRFDQVWEYEVVGEEGKTERLLLGDELTEVREIDARLRAAANQSTLGGDEGSTNELTDEDSDGLGDGEGSEQREQSVW